MNEPELKNVLITGGAGYVGNALVPQLLDAGYNVTVYDILYFGKATLPLDNPNLKVIEGDIRDSGLFAAASSGIDAVLHLACISNDPSFELDDNLSTSINFDCFEGLVLAARKAGVKRFVYCSTSSVYGVSDAPDVTEDHPLVPLTLYSKFKGMCEPILFGHQSPDFTCVTIRPATVCGYSARTRLDVSVNILTNHAVNKGKITVFGGVQRRPNLHIHDMCGLYQLLLEEPAENIAGETFNVGHQNLSIDEIAAIARAVVMQEFPDKGEIEIVHTNTNDLRSYHINSGKIARRLGFRTMRTVEDAVRDLCEAFRSGKLPESFDNDWYYNVRTMKQLNAA